MILFLFLLSTGILFDSAAGASHQDVLPANAEIVAEETAELILEWLDEDGELRFSDGRIMGQPLYLSMNAPPGVKEQIISHLINKGIRIASQQMQFHTLQVEWEPQNVLVQGRGSLNRRILSSDVIFSWYNADYEIQKTWKLSFVWEDNVPSNQVSVVTSDWPPAGFQHTKSSRRFSILCRLAEPALISGVVGVTIYLLYNVRR